MFIIYVIDTSVWIDLKYKYSVGKDPIWDKLQTLVDNKRIICPIEVFDELKKKRECEPYNWCKQNKQMFVDATNEMEHLADKLIKENSIWSLRRSQGRPAADPHIISMAKFYVDPQSKLDETSKVIVTQESPELKDKIPKTAEAHGIECINMDKFIRKEKLTLDSVET